MRDDVAIAAGFALAGFGTLGTTVLLVPVRDDAVGPTLAAAALFLVLATSTALAGPVAGAMATLTAALSFDFFFVQPYLELKVGRTADRWPVAALVIAGAGIVTASRHRAASDAAAPSLADPNPSTHVDRVERLIQQRADPRDLVLAVGAELTALLAARRCWFEEGETSSVRPRLALRVRDRPRRRRPSDRRGGAARDGADPPHRMLRDRPDNRRDCPGHPPHHGPDPRRSSRPCSRRPSVVHLLPHHPSPDVKRSP